MSVRHIKRHSSSLRKVNLSSENFSSVRLANIKKNDKCSIIKGVKKWTLACNNGIIEVAVLEGNLAVPTKILNLHIL